MKRVLVVDDTKNIRMLLSKCLELEGYEVITACDGLQAVEILLKETLDLAFLDIKMPHLSGTEVLKRVRETGISIPVIIITAYATVKNAVECTQMGAVAYLQKPFTADKVRSILSEVLQTSCQVVTTANLDYVLGNIETAIDERNFLKALELLKKALSVEPANKKIYGLLSSAYDGIGDKENAKKFHAMYEVM